MGNGKQLYEVIAGNIRKERRKLCITQGQLAERAGLSLDTIKSVEHGRRAMSLDTYLKIVQALNTTPLALMNWECSSGYIDRFICLIDRRDENEIEFVLHMVEQLLKGQDCYLCK